MTTNCASCGQPMLATETADICQNVACDWFGVPVNEDEPEDDTAVATRDRIWEDAW